MLAFVHIISLDGRLIGTVADVTAISTVLASSVSSEAVAGNKVIWSADTYRDIFTMTPGTASETPAAVAGNSSFIPDGSTFGGATWTQDPTSYLSDDIQHEPPRQETWDETLLKLTVNGEAASPICFRWKFISGWCTKLPGTTS